MQMASLDHAMWFHRPFRADDWLLYDQAALSDGVVPRAGRRFDLHRRRTTGGDRRAGGSGTGRAAMRRAAVAGSRSIAAALLLVAQLQLATATTRARIRRDRSATSATTARCADRCVDDRDASTDRPPVATVHRRRRPPATARHRRPSPPTTHAAAGVLVEPAVELFEIGQFDQPVDIVVAPDDPIGCSSSSRAGRCVAVDDESTEVVLDISDLVDADGASRACSGWPSIPTARPRVRQLHRRAGRHRRRRVRGRSGDRGVRPGLGARGLTVDQPYANHNGGKLVVRPRRAAVHRPRRRRVRRTIPSATALDLTHAARQDPAHRSGAVRRPSRTRSRPTTRSSASTVPTRRSGRSGSATRGASRSTRPPATSGSPTSARTSSRRSTTRPPTGGVDAGRGLNFGWSAFEGDAPFNDDQPADGHTRTDLRVLARRRRLLGERRRRRPRRDASPDLAGWYVFGDYCTGEIWALDPASAPDAPAASSQHRQPRRTRGDLGRRRRRAVRRSPTAARSPASSPPDAAHPLR